MTVDEVITRVNEIAACAGDDEGAHSMEDKLRADVLRAIVAGADRPEALAAAALQTDVIEFARWCA